MNEESDWHKRMAILENAVAPTVVTGASALHDHDTEFNSLITGGIDGAVSFWAAAPLPLEFVWEQSATRLHLLRSRAANRIFLAVALKECYGNVKQRKPAR